MVKQAFLHSWFFILKECLSGFLYLRVYLTIRELIFCCFCVVVGQAGGGVDREVFLNVKHGVEAKNYEDVSYMLG